MLCNGLQRRVRDAFQCEAKLYIVGENPRGRRVAARRKPFLATAALGKKKHRETEPPTTGRDLRRAEILDFLTVQSRSRAPRHGSSKMRRVRTIPLLLCSLPPSPPTIFLSLSTLPSTTTLPSWLYAAYDIVVRYLTVVQSPTSRLHLSLFASELDSIRTGTETEAECHRHRTSWTYTSRSISLAMAPLESSEKYGGSRMAWCVIIHLLCAPAIYGSDVQTLVSSVVVSFVSVTDWSMVWLLWMLGADSLWLSWSLWCGYRCGRGHDRCGHRGGIDPRSERTQL